MSDTTFSDATGTPIVATWLNDVNAAIYRAQSGVAGTINRTALSKLSDFVSLKDFGAIGTAAGAAANEAADTAALTAALASGRNIYIPDGTYYFSTTITVGANTKIWGSGKGKVTIYYSGTGNMALVGTAGPTISLTYNCELGGFTIIATNRASTVKGICLQNAVYFRIFDIVSVGSGDPNSGTPANRVLYGEGLSVTDNSILGTIENVSCRVWNFGYYFWTRSTSASNWCAAIDVKSGEVANNMYGIVIGDSTVGFSTAAGVKFHSVWVQGNYTTGIKNYSGEKTVFDTIYFEGNANYDYDEAGGTASPAKCTLRSSVATSADIGTTNYGTFPYISKARVRGGSFCTIEDNDFSISTSIPLVITDSGAIEPRVINNRLNSGAATTSRIQNASTTLISANNSPEAPTVAIVNLTRLLNAATGSVAYTGFGFKPTSVQVTCGQDAAVPKCFGVGGLTNGGILSRCQSIDSSNNNNSSADFIRIITSVGNEQKASIASFDNDGLTLNWTLVGAPPANTMQINLIARR